MGGTGSERRLRRIKYRALPSQSRFHRCKQRFKGFSGPIGSGKSQALCQEALKLSYVNAGRTGLIGAPTYPMLRDATQVTMLEILNENGIPYELNKAEHVVTIKETGSRVLFRAVDEFDRLRGMNLAWFGLDELTYTPEDAWLVLEGRLRDPKATRLCGFGVWTPKGYDWVYRRFLDSPVAGYEAIIAGPSENVHLLAKVPDFYERLLESYDERFYRQEALGEYLNVQEGRVYYNFRRVEHVKEVTVEGSLKLLWALDFNVDPMCSVIAQIAGQDVRVLDEIVLSRSSTLEACQEFHRRLGYHAAGVTIYGDATGNRQQTAGTSDYQIIREFFRASGYRNVSYKVPRSNPPVEERVALVNARLQSAGGEAHLSISSRCRELIRDFEEVTYKPDSQIVEKGKDPKRTHLSDALGYLIWQECRPPVGERDQRLF